MRLIFDIIGQTFRALWAHKLRSFLTMFGIAWGVGSLLLLVGLGEGFRSGNRKQFDSMGENVMFIWSGRAPVMQGSFTALRQYYLTYRDYEDILRECPSVGAAAPVIAAATSARSAISSRPAARSWGFRPSSIRSATCPSTKAAGSMTWTMRRSAP